LRWSRFESLIVSAGFIFKKLLCGCCGNPKDDGVVVVVVVVVSSSVVVGTVGLMLKNEAPPS
jgi:hypothetical protein